MVDALSQKWSAKRISGYDTSLLVVCQRSSELYQCTNASFRGHYHAFKVWQKYNEAKELSETVRSHHRNIWESTNHIVKLLINGLLL